MKKFEQLKRQYNSLINYFDMEDLSNKNISAATADFDRLFELSWKTLKAYLFDSLGIYEAKTGSPREILKLAAAQGLIRDDLLWFEMLKDRNDDSHIYRRASAIIYMSKIAACYLPQIEKLVSDLKPLIPEESWEEPEIPQSMLEYSLRCRKPLYQLIEDVRTAYQCQTDAQIFEKWNAYRKEKLGKDGF